jgi:hypothetical protein
MPLMVISYLFPVTVLTKAYGLILFFASLDFCTTAKESQLSGFVMPSVENYPSLAA